MHAFVDESRRGSNYLVAAVLVRPREFDSTRRQLRALAKRGQRRVHFQSESDARRRLIIAQLVGSGVQAHVWVCGHKSDIEARERCLGAIAERLANLGVSRLVIESNQHQDQRDRRVLARALRSCGRPFSYEHMRPTEDPILWAADAVAWCYGAGGDWRRRIRTILREVHEVE